MLLSVAALAILLQCQSGLCSPRSNVTQRDLHNRAVAAGRSRSLFYDDFTQARNFLPDPTKWTIDRGTSYPGGPGNWGTGEIQSYTGSWDTLYITRDNTLKITPRYRGTWTSARIETTSAWDFACRRGETLRIEARLKLGDNPEYESLGIWPAFWALGSDYRGNYQNWPSVGEIDILESVNGERRIHFAAHCGSKVGGVCNEPAGLHGTSGYFSRGRWHTVAWEVDRTGGGEESMSWYLDGEVQYTLTESDVGDWYAWRALAASKKMVLLNVAVGGSFPDGVSGETTPTWDTLSGDGAGMEIDYVSVYSWW